MPLRAGAGCAVPTCCWPLLCCCKLGAVARALVASSRELLHGRLFASDMCILRRQVIVRLRFKLETNTAILDRRLVSYLAATGACCLHGHSPAYQLGFLWALTVWFGPYFVSLPCIVSGAAASRGTLVLCHLVDILHCSVSTTRFRGSAPILMQRTA